MKVSNEIFYHIHRLGNETWMPGNHIRIGNKYNQFYTDLINGLDKEKTDHDKKLIYEMSSATSQKLDLNSLSVEKARDEITKLSYLINESIISFRQYLKWIREEIFEKIRKEISITAPSRQKCLWICNESDLPTWIDIFKEKSTKVLKISVSGTIHITDGKFIEADTFSIHEIEEKAKKYWSGIMTLEPEKEYLFEGDVCVIEEYKTINKIIR